MERRKKEHGVKARVRVKAGRAGGGNRPLSSSIEGEIDKSERGKERERQARVNGGRGGGIDS